MPQLDESPVFIGGQPRSGTTLLLTLLDGHPDLLVFPEETSFFKDLMPACQRGPERAERMLLGRLRFYATQREKRHRVDLSDFDLPLYERRLKDRLRGSAAAPKAFLQAMVLAFEDVTGETPRKRYWVEKTPGNEAYGPLIRS